MVSYSQSLYRESVSQLVFYAQSLYRESVSQLVFYAQSLYRGCTDTARESLR